MMTDFDVTTNRIRFDMLTEDEAAALKAWPHGWEVYLDHSYWYQTDYPSWENSHIYRGLPAPVVTSNWFNVYPHKPMSCTYLKRQEADVCASDWRIAVLRIDTCDGVSTAHLEGV